MFRVSPRAGRPGREEPERSHWGLGVWDGLGGREGSSVAYRVPTHWVGRVVDHHIEPGVPPPSGEGRIEQAGKVDKIPHIGSKIS